MEQIGKAIERLLTDESLTADVDDAAAKALLRWGQEQLQAGRPEENVRLAVKALARLVGQRASLDPATARARLEAAGLAVEETTLAGLWAEALPAGTWAEKLLQALTSSPLPAAGGRGEGVRATPWWRRLLFWRRD